MDYKLRINFLLSAAVEDDRSLREAAEDLASLSSSNERTSSYYSKVTPKYEDAKMINCKVVEQPAYKRWSEPKESGRFSEQKRETYLKLWMSDLRNKAYKVRTSPAFTLQDMFEESSKENASFRCSFNSCGRAIKGRGNLKRHVVTIESFDVQEWHLRKAEVENRQKLLDMNNSECK